MLAWELTLIYILLFFNSLCKRKYFFFSIFAQDRMENSNMGTMHLVMICFTDRANWLLTMVDCNWHCLIEERGILLIKRQTYPNWVRTQTFKSIDYKMKILHLLDLNSIWYCNYFYYHPFHVFWKGIHIYSQGKKNTTP